MPLKSTPYGGICPLGRFSIDVEGGCGGYDSDPVEACLKCNFSDLDLGGFDLAKVCQCPSNMDWPEYNRLRKSYVSGDGKKTKKEFWEFVTKNYRQPAA
jgi:hypothetical protein